MNGLSQTPLFIDAGNGTRVAVVLLISAVLVTTTEARGAGSEAAAKPKISHVFFAQHHVQTPDSPYFKLVGDLEALVKVHVNGRKGLSSPDVLVRLGLKSKTLDLKLKGPSLLPGPVTGEAVLIKHAYGDSFVAIIPREWIAAGLQMEIELREHSSSADKRGALLDRKLFGNLNIGAPTRLIMTMFDFHFFGGAKGADYPKGWFEELGSKLPVAELELRRVRNIILDKVVMPPRGEKPATLCGSREEYQKKTGMGFDGEQGITGNWRGALREANGGGWGGTRRVYFGNIYGVPCGGTGGGLAGVGNGRQQGILSHELGHAFGLPHWFGHKEYPYVGDMYGISSPGGSDFPHVGPTWAFDLIKHAFISPSENGSYKKDPMYGGGQGDGKPYLYRQFSDYSVSRIRDTFEKTQVVWDERAGSYMAWDQGTGSYSIAARRRGSPTVPIEDDIEVISVLASASLVTREANIVYPPIGPYKAGRIETFDASDPDNRSRARGAGFNDSTCNTCLRVTQDKKVTTYVIKDRLSPNDDPKQSESLAVFAISLPARNGEVTQVDLLRTPGVLSSGVAKDSEILYSWRGSSQAPRTETVTAIYPDRPVMTVRQPEAKPPAKPAAPATKAAPQDKGWDYLFEYDLSNASAPKGVWSNEGGGLTACQDKNIWTKKLYTDFILDLEFKTAPGANSGVIVHCSDANNWIPNSVEVQIADDFADESAKSDAGWRCGAILGHLAPNKSMVKKPGEWNRMTVTCKGKIISVTLNGEQVAVMDMAKWTSAKTNPDGSKIPEWLSKPKAELPLKGRIGLQGKHAGAPACFRNIKIKELKQ